MMKSCIKNIKKYLGQNKILQKAKYPFVFLICIIFLYEKLYGFDDIKVYLIHSAAKNNRIVSLNIYSKIFPNDIYKSLDSAVSQGNYMAIKNILKLIKNPQFRDRDGTSPIGKISTLVKNDIYDYVNYYDKNNLNAPSDKMTFKKAHRNLGIELLKDYKAPGSDLSISESIELSLKYITDIKALKIPGSLGATYNPSIIKYKDGYLLAFRMDNMIKYYHPDERHNEYTSEIGLVKLDKDLNIVGQYQKISNSIMGCPERCTAEDPRLFEFQNKPYIIFNRGEYIPSHDNQTSRRMYMGVLDEDQNGDFKINDILALVSPRVGTLVERNWTPFVHGNVLYLIYSTEPFLTILKPNLKTGISEIVQDEAFDTGFLFGQVKGGTPLLEIDKNKYIGFFHSNVLADNRKLYYMVPAIFSYDLNHGNFKFDEVAQYPYFLSLNTFPREIKVSLFFPSGLVKNGDDLILSTGKNDSEIVLFRLNYNKIIGEFHQ